MNLAFVKRWRLPDVTWSELGAIGRSPASRLTIFVPVLGYLVLLNQEFLRFIQLVTPPYWTTDAHASLAPPTKLILTYLGLCCLGIASALFVIFCPKGPKQHASESEFALASAQLDDPSVNFERLVVVGQWFGKLSAVLKEDSFTVMRALNILHMLARDMAARGHRNADFGGKNLADEVSGSMPFTLFEEVKFSLAAEKVGLAAVWFAIADRKNKLARTAIWMLYVTGFGLIAIPTVWTVAQVLWQVFLIR